MWEVIWRITVYPSSHYVTPRSTVLDAIETIKLELAERIGFCRVGTLLCPRGLRTHKFGFPRGHSEAVPTLHETGFCKGIKNYLRHLSGRKAGEPPPTLMDYLPPDALMFIDESHVTIPQICGMYKGDHEKRKSGQQSGQL